MIDFKTLFLTQFFQYVHKYEKNNWDYIRFPNGNQRKDSFLIDRAVQQTSFIMDNIQRFEYAYNLLQDEYSRQLMLKLLQYKVLDHHHVKLPMNCPEYWDACANADDKYLMKKDVFFTGRFMLNQYFLPEYSMMLYGPEGAVITLLYFRQYFYEHETVIKPQPGDVVIDAGACWGEIALLFARTVGESGQVHSFEFVESNLDIMRKNLDENPDLGKRISIVKKALNDKSGEYLQFADRGPSTSFAPSQDASFTAETITIDEYAEKAELKSVDFIKMDIEGSEVPALKGASETIKKFTPKLAISAYHKLDDLFTIPMTILDINPNYTFYLDHYTIHNEETVIYAIKKK